LINGCGTLPLGIGPIFMSKLALLPAAFTNRFRNSLNVLFLLSFKSNPHESLSVAQVSKEAGKVSGNLTHARFVPEYLFQTSENLHLPMV
jgi:hypothetical protein